MMFDAELLIEADSWATRGEYWRQQVQRPVRPRGRRERCAEPLILCGHGVSMRIESGALVIRDGLTHHPQPRDRYRYFKGDLALPPRVVMVDGSGSVTFDVLTWLGEQGVALICLNWKGEVLSVLSPQGHAADRQKIQWQIDTRADHARRMAFSTALVTRKIAASIDTLERAVPSSRRRDTALSKAHDMLAVLRATPPDDMTALRFIEASCAKAYFGAWRDLVIKWNATARRPIPDDWRVFTSRSSLSNGAKLKNVNASHPINAMLNYAYGVLHSRLRVQAVGEGYDPTLGIMHHGYQGNPAYVFDLMEPERPKVDAAILEFVAEYAFTGADFTINEGGVCRLSPQLARQVCGIAGRSQ